MLEENRSANLLATQDASRIMSLTQNGSEFMDLTRERLFITCLCTRDTGPFIVGFSFVQYEENFLPF